MGANDRAGLAIKQTTVIEKYRSDEEAADGAVAPYEVIETESRWMELDGTEITDPERIARLERKAGG